MSKPAPVMTAAQVAHILQQSVSLYVDSGFTIRTIIAKLDAEGWIKNDEYFRQEQIELMHKAKVEEKTKRGWFKFK